jgi:hypothetical protein
MAKKSTEIVPTMLRIREDLRKRLEREAKKRDHSLNAEMVERLEQSFVDDAQNERDLTIIGMMMNSDDIGIGLMRKIVLQLWKRRMGEGEFNIKKEEVELNRLLSARGKLSDDSPLREPLDNPTTPKKSDK